MRRSICLVLAVLLISYVGVISAKKVGPSTIQVNLEGSQLSVDSCFRICLTLLLFLFDKNQSIRIVFSTPQNLWFPIKGASRRMFSPPRVIRQIGRTLSITGVSRTISLGYNCILLNFSPISQLTRGLFPYKFAPPFFHINPQSFHTNGAMYTVLRGDKLLEAK